MDNKINDISNFYSAENGDFNYLYKDHIDFSKTLFEEVELIFKEYNVKSVIDCCCAVGNDLKYLSQKGYDVFGSDLSFDMANAATRSLNNENISAKIIQSDVLYINENTEEKFDLVIFRGNALGHLNNDEQKRAIDNLFRITKEKGLVFLDFRDGQTYHRKRKKIELRGYGNDKQHKKIYFSFYILKHPKSIFEQYKIKSKTLIFDYKKFRFKYVHGKIEANYVIFDSIIDRIKYNNGQILFKKTSSDGFPELQSLIILNNRSK